MEIDDDFEILQRRIDVRPHVPFLKNKVLWTNGDPYPNMFSNNVQLALLNDDFRKSLHGFF